MRKLSHAYMLTGPHGAGREQAVKELAAALLCSEENAPCRNCRDCRKVLSGVHPDVITVERQTDDKGRLRQEILVGQIRAVTADAYVAPNEASRKVYVIREADRMNTEAQNALLKALEEPPGHACFLLCTATADALLPTIRSRCVRIDDTVRSDETKPLSALAGEYIQLLAKESPSDMTRFCLLRAKLTREEADALFEEIGDALGDILCARRPDPGLTVEKIRKASASITHARELIRRNISPKQVFGLLAVQFDIGESDDRRDKNH